MLVAALHAFYTSSSMKRLSSYFCVKVCRFDMSTCRPLGCRCWRWWAPSVNGAESSMLPDAWEVNRSRCRYVTMKYQNLYSPLQFGDQQVSWQAHRQSLKVSRLATQPRWMTWTYDQSVLRETLFSCDLFPSRLDETNLIVSLNHNPGERRIYTRFALLYALAYLSGRSIGIR
jgi:hypothetical protein